jgi:hypothetical protein
MNENKYLNLPVTKFLRLNFRNNVYNIYPTKSASQTIIIEDKRKNCVYKIWGKKIELVYVESLEYEKNIYQNKIKPIIDEYKDKAPFLKPLGCSDKDGINVKELVEKFDIDYESHLGIFMVLSLYYYLYYDNEKNYIQDDLLKFFILYRPYNCGELLTTMINKKFGFVCTQLVPRCTTLGDYLVSNNIGFDSLDTKEILAQVLAGLYIMKLNNIYHNDLHSGNIFITDDKQILIYDWDRSYCPDQGENSRCNNNPSVSPCSYLLNCNLEYPPFFSHDFFRLIQNICMNFQKSYTKSLNHYLKIMVNLFFSEISILDMEKIENIFSDKFFFPTKNKICNQDIPECKIITRRNMIAGQDQQSFKFLKNLFGGIDEIIIRYNQNILSDEKLNLQNTLTLYKELQNDILEKNKEQILSLFSDEKTILNQLEALDIEQKKIEQDMKNLDDKINTGFREKKQFVKIYELYQNTNKLYSGQKNYNPFKSDKQGNIDYANKIKNQIIQLKNSLEQNVKFKSVMDYGFVVIEKDLINNINYNDDIRDEIIKNLEQQIDNYIKTGISVENINTIENIQNQLNNLEQIFIIDRESKNILKNDIVANEEKKEFLKTYLQLRDKIEKEQNYFKRIKFIELLKKSLKNKMNGKDLTIPSIYAELKTKEDYKNVKNEIMNLINSKFKFKFPVPLLRTDNSTPKIINKSYDQNIMEKIYNRNNLSQIYDNVEQFQESITNLLNIEPENAVYLHLFCLKSFYHNLKSINDESETIPEQEIISVSPPNYKSSAELMSDNENSKKLISESEFKK